MIPVTDVLERQRRLDDTPNVPIMSILICSINERAGLLASLLSNLEKQAFKFLGLVEILVSLDNKGENTTGAKRNALVKAAKGEFVCFIDDDDEVSENYISLILSVIPEDDLSPDTIGIRGTYSEDGRLTATWEISKHFVDYTGKQNGRTHYWRHTNHLAPVQRNIALQCPFPNTSWEEDSAYSKALHASRLIRTEVKVVEPIYHYRYKKFK